MSASVPSLIILSFSKQFVEQLLWGQAPFQLLGIEEWMRPGCPVLMDLTFQWKNKQNKKTNKMERIISVGNNYEDKTDWGGGHFFKLLSQGGPL